MIIIIITTRMTCLLYPGLTLLDIYLFQLQGLIAYTPGLRIFFRILWNELFITTHQTPKAIWMMLHGVSYTRTFNVHSCHVSPEPVVSRTFDHAACLYSFIRTTCVPHAWGLSSLLLYTFCEALHLLHCILQRAGSLPVERFNQNRHGV